MPDRTRVRHYRDTIVRDLRELIRIPSVKGDSCDGAPFGREAARALEFMLARGRELGFATKNIDNYAGHVEYGSDGPIIGVLTHLDVVPAGDGWNHDPFGGEVDDGAVYGRGAADNKGPAVAALYVLRAFADEAPAPKVRVRVIFGANEESGMEGVRRYFEREPLPDVGFAPDAGYPLYNREMGIINIHLSAKRNGRAIVSDLSGGEALNMVAGEARATVLPAYREIASRVVEETDSRGTVEHRIVFDGSHDAPVITVKGISAHGGRPATGVSAIAYLVQIIDDIARAVEERETNTTASENRIVGNGVIEREIRELRRLIGFETRGDSLGIACRDSESGELSVNWGTIRVDADTVETGLNIRYPVTADFGPIVSALTWRAKRAGFTSTGEHHAPPLFVPEDSDLVVRLLRAYETVTGEKASPMSMSGGTYARMLKNRGVAFGAGFPGEATNVHQPDEHISIDSLMRHCEISLQALFELSNAPPRTAAAT